MKIKGEGDMGGLRHTVTEMARPAPAITIITSKLPPGELFDRDHDNIIMALYTCADNASAVLPVVTCVCVCLQLPWRTTRTHLLACDDAWLRPGNISTVCSYAHGRCIGFV